MQREAESGACENIGDHFENERAATSSVEDVPFAPFKGDASRHHVRVFSSCREVPASSSRSFRQHEHVGGSSVASCPRELEARLRRRKRSGADNRSSSSEDEGRAAGRGKRGRASVKMEVTADGKRRLRFVEEEEEKKVEGEEDGAARKISFASKRRPTAFPGKARHVSDEEEDSDDGRGTCTRWTMDRTVGINIVDLGFWGDVLVPLRTGS